MTTLTSRRRYRKTRWDTTVGFCFWSTKVPVAFNFGRALKYRDSPYNKNRLIFSYFYYVLSFYCSNIASFLLTKRQWENCDTQRRMRLHKRGFPSTHTKVIFCSALKLLLKVVFVLKKPEAVFTSFNEDSITVEIYTKVTLYYRLKLRQRSGIRWSRKSECYLYLFDSDRTKNAPLCERLWKNS